MAKDEVDQVVLVGGSTRIPKVNKINIGTRLYKFVSLSVCVWLHLASTVCCCR